MATIRKRGDLQWEARIRRKGWPVTCKTFTTKLDAEKWARDVEGEVDRGIFTSRTEAERTTRLEAIADTTDYITILYNRQRRQSALDYLSPVAFAQNERLAQKATVAA